MGSHWVGAGNFFKPIGVFFAGFDFGPHYFINYDIVYISSSPKGRAGIRKGGDFLLLIKTLVRY